MGSERVVISAEDILNEFQYVIENAPDEVSRNEAREVALAGIREIEKIAHAEGFRLCERSYFND